MRSISISRGLRHFAVLAGCLALSSAAHAHVAFDALRAGDTLVAGETVSIAWTDLVLHDPESFDLDLLLSEDGQAVPIAHGLSVDTHSYEWVVPDHPCNECLLRVTQLNTFNDDYWDAIPVTITSSGTSGGSGGTSGSAGEDGGGTGGSSGGGASNGGASGSSSNDGGTNSGGGSDAIGGTAGLSAANAGSSAAGAPAAGAGSSGDGDGTSAGDGCSSAAGAPSPATPGAITALLLALTAWRRTRSHRRFSHNRHASS